MSLNVTPAALRADSIRFWRLLSNGLSTFRWSATGSSIASGGTSAISAGRADDIWSRLTPIWPANSIHSSTARSGSFLRLSRGVSSWSAAVRTLSCMYSGLKSVGISSSLILDIDVFPGLGALQDRVADHRAAVAVLERRAVRRHVLLVHDAVEQVVDLVDHRVLPPDDVTVGPPVRHEGVVAFADDDLVEALGLLRLLADPEDIELVQVLEVELDRALLAADLEAAVVLPARGEARRLEGADRAALELD